LFFTWVITMYKGKIRFTTPMLWFLGFVGVFAAGGITGVMLAIPPADFQLHNSLFLVAHFHSNVIGGVLFGVFAGITYWFPKIAGFRLNERIGRYAFWCWIVGFCLSFIPMYILGLMGATRRLDHYDSSTGWQPFYVMMLLGGIVIAIGVALQIVQIIASFLQKRRLIDTTGDPWDARTLEWSVPSPAPHYNFAVIPNIASREPFWDMKHGPAPKPKFENIHMPKSTASGIYISIFAFLAGFAFVWEITWLAVVSIIAVIICVVSRTFDENIEYTLTAAEVEKHAAAIRKEQEVQKWKSTSANEDDMGLIEFIRVALRWALGLVGLGRKTR
jgi:cytochrome o ubiquinol oxidase subunit 1